MLKKSYTEERPANGDNTEENGNEELHPTKASVFKLVSIFSIYLNKLDEKLKIKFMRCRR